VSDPVKACLVRDLNAQNSPWPELPVVALYVYHARWEGLTAEGAKDVRLTLHECDYPDEASTARQDPTAMQDIAELAFDLLPRESDGDGDADRGNSARAKKKRPAFTVSGARIVRLFWAGKMLTQGFPADDERSASADFALFLGGTTYIPLSIPGDKERFHQEGASYEIGMTLAHASLSAPYERLTSDLVASSWVPAGDTLQRVLSLSTPMTGVARLEPQFTKRRLKDGEPMRLGRFDDPDRHPPVPPDRAPVELDALTLAELPKHGPDHPVDLDGLRFHNVVPLARRLDAIAWLDERIERLPGKGGKPSETWKTSDMSSAYFIIHDIGAGHGTAVFPDMVGHARAFKKERHANGFLNVNGSYTVYSDLRTVSQATVYQGMKYGEWMRPYGINIECVVASTKRSTNRASTKDASDVVPRRVKTRGKGQDAVVLPMQDRYACVVYQPSGGGAFYKWTHELLDALARLYVLASARANHLLTVSVHVELDRSLSVSHTFYEYDEDALRARSTKGVGGGFWKLLYGPENAHGDPQGLDVQVFYDKVTLLLNDLKREFGGALPDLPAGVRYGVNPKRLLEGPSARSDDRQVWVGNEGDQINTFPHQSGDVVLRLAVDKNQGRRKFFYANDGRRHGGERNPGPWWHADFKPGRNVYEDKGVENPYDEWLAGKKGSKAAKNDDAAAK
jgi:hypothetical protein